LPDLDSVIFDLDGTLVTIPVDWRGVREELRRAFKTESDFVPLFKALEDMLKQKLETRKKAFSTIDEFEKRALPGAKLLPGALPLLNQLVSQAKLALVTMQGRAACQLLFSRLGLDEYFPFYLTREDSLERAEQVTMALEKLGAPPARTLFVGDRQNDLVAGRKAGVAVAIVGKAPAGENLEGVYFEDLLELRTYLSARS
jgi:HAD superfamily hydrolase (TIGR01549 family)